MTPAARLVALCACISILAACGKDGAGSGSGGGSSPSGRTDGRTFAIAPGPNATTDMVAAMVQAAPGDVISFGCGFFDLTQTLQLINTEDVLIKGCGRDKTVLSFRNATSGEGILIVNVAGITIQDLTVIDTVANAFELRGVDHGTLRRVRGMWSSGGGRASADPVTRDNYAADNARRLNVPCTTPPTRNPRVPENVLLGGTDEPDYAMDPNTGRYAIYPVLSRNILIEESEAVGASDAGIYVGQSNNAIIRKNRSIYAPFAYEIENVRGGEYDSNLAECATGGFLVYDLDGLTQYGDSSRVHGNIVRNNNAYNVAEHPGLVRSVPPGTGFITLGYDRIDIFDNEFIDNNTTAILHFSYSLFPKADQPGDKRMDFYSEGVHIFRNKFTNNGSMMPMPTSTDLQNQDLLRAFPLVIGLKNQAGCLNPLNAAACAAAGPGAIGVKGAHILFDGAVDTYDPDCPYPAGVPKDSRGKPVSGNAYPNPSCIYNAYKFDTTKSGNPLIKPDWFPSCIDDDNVFTGGSFRYANFHALKGLEPVLAAASLDPADPASFPGALASIDPVALSQFGSDFDMSPHSCAAKYGKNLPLLPAIVIPPFERSGEFDPGPTAAEVEKLCGAKVAAGQANFAAAKVDCPTLDQYHLFSDAEDPTSAPNGGGVPFALTTKLFSDYAVKYRVVYLPPGAQATYNDRNSNGVDATIVFPVGTIIAKTFSFPKSGVETPFETRLLIKRVNSKGRERWDGSAYVWKTEGGKRVARLALGGATGSPSWDYSDVDSGLHHTGSTSSYLVPNRNQCLTCHSAANKEPGAAPIGPKIRFLNRPYASESSIVTDQGSHLVAGKNQVKFWCENGLMTGCPALTMDNAKQIATNLERVPVYNKPGDSGLTDPKKDLEARARAYLEVNCQHCHNPKGFAASTGFYLDSFRAVDGSYGICKQPTAAGAAGAGGRTYDIKPASSNESIIEFRIGPDATTSAARMPPLARSVSHDEGHDLIAQWIDDVIVADETKYPNSTRCGE